MLRIIEGSDEQQAATMVAEAVFDRLADAAPEDHKAIGVGETRVFLELSIWPCDLTHLSNPLPSSVT